ncbi:MBL fold metallo-hydrolase [Flavobacteriales bacterium]|jgi:glyoxylase-like metal-dependent hydrolase (beta-lactamase superfamily II)/rhodanese-related sulfurtransferase|nr:MBL fold metallo-hydrolase [Flavobacteriales bacterium]
MKIEQIYTGCLAQGAYYIESNGEVAIIDPMREVSEYIDLANSRGAKIKYIFETHFHADFVSGHLTLSERTGAPIIFGPTATTSFDSITAVDNQEFKLGDVTIKVLHTPGHTMESTCYLLIDESGKEHSLFSGDTLFLGDVGRPDLAVKSDLTAEDLAGHLFDSLRTKIMTLADDVIVYPGHGAGSACGKNISIDLVGSIGNQKENNYALRSDMTKEEFVKEVTEGILPPPAYFPLNVGLNRDGYKDADKVLSEGKNPLKPTEFEITAENTEAIILDVRHQDEFAKGHIPNSIFIGINGGFAPWVGALIKDVNQAILLVCHDDQLDETIKRLSRVGFDTVIGYLEGGFSAWKSENKEVATVETISSDDFSTLLAKEDLHVMDVRKESEYISEHVISAKNTPLDYLNQFMGEFSKEKTNYVHCAGGYRSMIANSILKARGIHNLVDVQGGFGAIKTTTAPVSEFVCPSTL